MKLIRLSHCLLFLFLVFFIGCTEIEYNYKSPDIKKFASGKGIRYDLRILKETYGHPPIYDNSSKKFGYYNIYFEYSGLFFFDLDPWRSEIWYLILSPT